MNYLFKDFVASDLTLDIRNSIRNLILLLAEIKWHCLNAVEQITNTMRDIKV